MNSTMQATKSFATYADECLQQNWSIKVISARSIKCTSHYSVTSASVGKSIAAYRFFRCVWLNPIPFDCRLKHKDALKGHMLRHVQGPQKCLVCDHISPNRKALAKHKQTHDLQRKERFRCPTCGKCCRDKMSLQVNMLRWSIICIESIHLAIIAFVFRSIPTSTPVSLADIIARIVAKYFDSVHRFVCTKRKCIQSEDVNFSIQCIHLLSKL